MDFDVILNSLLGFAPWVQYILMGLGAVVALGTLIDKFIPDTMDKGFMGVVFNVPVLGALLKALAKFSPFNVRE